MFHVTIGVEIIKGNMFIFTRTQTGCPSLDLAGGGGSLLVLPRAPGLLEGGARSRQGQDGGDAGGGGGARPWRHPRNAKGSRAAQKSQVIVIKHQYITNGMSSLVARMELVHEFYRNKIGRAHV